MGNRYASNPDWEPTTILSRREWLILRMMAGGIMKKEICVALGLQMQTVISYAKRGRAKLQRRGYRTAGTNVGLQRLVERGIF